MLTHQSGNAIELEKGLWEKSKGLHKKNIEDCGTIVRL